MREKLKEIKAKFFIYIRKIQFSILFSFFMLMLFTSGSIILYTYKALINEMSVVVDEQVDALVDGVSQRVLAFLSPVKDITLATSWVVNTEEQIIHSKDTVGAQLMGLLDAFPQISGFTIATENGSSLTVYRVLKESPFQFHPERSLTANIRYRLTLINKGSTPTEEMNEYYDAEGTLVTSEQNSFSMKRDKDASIPFLFDARTRPWYIGARKTQAVFWTDIHLYADNAEMGITVGCPVYNNLGHFIGVASADVNINELSNFFKIQSTGPVALSFLFNGKGQIVAYPDIDKVFKFKPKHLEIEKIENIKEFNLKEAYKIYLKTGKQKKFLFNSNSTNSDDIAYFVKFPESFGEDWTLGVIVLGDNFIGNIANIRKETLIFCFFMLFLSTLLMILISKRISWPIEVVAQDLRQIKNLDFDTKFQIRSQFFEISQMLEALRGVVSGLQSFGKFVPKMLVQQLVQTGLGAQLGGEKKSLTVFFCDIQGFTSISEKMHTEQLLLHLSDYFEELTRLIKGNQGTLDKYIGDAIMAFWGAPLPDVQHAFHACHTALVCLQHLDTLNAQWVAEEKPALYTRFGISTGQMLVGNMGSSDRLQYTVLGDLVNLGARLEALNKTYGTKILVSENTYNQTQELFVFRPVDLVAVRGKESGVQIYELLSEYSQNAAHYPVSTAVDLSLRTAEAYHAYCQHKWEEALVRYQKVQHDFPGDVLSTVFEKRCQRFIDSPPDPSWDRIMRTGMEF